MRLLTKAILTITLTGTLVTTAGVYATWNYAQYEPLPQGSTELSVGLSTWKGVEILPTDTENGKNHLSFIENLKNDLNSSDSQAQALIDSRIDRGRKNFGTMAVTGGDDLSGILGDENADSDFLIYYPQTATENTNLDSPDTYYVFSTSVGLGHKGECSGFLYYWNSKAGIHFFWDGTTNGTKHRIYEVYRTKMQKNAQGVWEATTTDVGSVLPCWYDENKSDSYKNVTQIPSFDPATYRTVDELSIGTAENPAYAYINYDSEKGYECETVDANITTGWGEKWYKLTPEMRSGVASGTVTLKLASANAANGLIVCSAADESAAITQNDGSGAVSFKAAAGVTYYVMVRGNTAISFTVSFTE